VEKRAAVAAAEIKHFQSFRDPEALHQGLPLSAWYWQFE
jgi:hypothetical protein